MTRTKNNGVIIEKKRGVYEVQLSLGVDPETGKYSRISRTVHGTKADAQKELRSLIKQKEDGINLKKSSMTFKEFSTQWHESRVTAATLAPSTLKGEEPILAALNEHIGNIKLEALTPARIDGLYNQIRKEGSRSIQGKPLSETTMVKYHEVLSKILKKAVHYDLILRNPCDRVTRPKVAQTERKSLTKENGAKLLKCVLQTEEEAKRSLELEIEKATQKEDSNSNITINFSGGISALGNIVAVHVGLATGARRGEVFGLSWRDVEMVQTKQGLFCTLKIRHTLDAYGNIKEPKTKTSKRDIAIDKTTASSLSTLRNMQALYLNRIGLKQTAQTPVFCSNFGGNMDLHNFERWWREWRKESGFPTLKFHELRHTQATQLLANGVDVKTVQNRLGHANAAITLNWYAHALPENDKKAAALIGVLFSENPKNELENTNIIPLSNAL